jgi:hypothetical protein
VAIDEEQLKAFVASIPNMPVDKRVKLYIKTREKKSEAARQAKLEAAQYDLIMSACENLLLLEADKTGVTGFKTDFGTTYVAETAKVSIADQTAFFGFVLQTQDLDFFEKRVSSTHLDEWQKMNPTLPPPPGLTIFRERVMRVRKADGK